MAAVLHLTGLLSCLLTIFWFLGHPYGEWMKNQRKDISKTAGSDERLYDDATATFAQYLPTENQVKVLFWVSIWKVIHWIDEDANSGFKTMTVTNCQL